MSNDIPIEFVDPYHRYTYQYIYVYVCIYICIFIFSHTDLFYMFLYVYDVLTWTVIEGLEGGRLTTSESDHPDVHRSEGSNPVQTTKFQPFSVHKEKKCREECQQ